MVVPAAQAVQAVAVVSPAVRAAVGVALQLPVPQALQVLAAEQIYPAVHVAVPQAYE